MKGKLYLIPTTLGDSPVSNVIPSYISEIINQTNFYIVENIRSARRYLIKAGIKTAIDDLHFFELNKRTDPKEIPSFFRPIGIGENVGVLSEAGVPSVADPGAEVVKIAHEKKIKVVPLVGPSSILMAIMASGMNGQNFAFVGYLPIKNPDRNKRIAFLEARSQKENQTQLFIETPYRNAKIISDILASCSNETRFCIACDISLETEFIKTKTVREWKKNIPKIDKRPAIFLIHKG